MSINFCRFLLFIDNHLANSMKYQNRWTHNSCRILKTAEKKKERIASCGILEMPGKRGNVKPSTCTRAMEAGTRELIRQNTRKEFVRSGPAGSVSRPERSNRWHRPCGCCVRTLRFSLYGARATFPCRHRSATNVPQAILNQGQVKPDHVSAFLLLP